MARPTPRNDTDTDPTTINQTRDLTITKSHTGNFSQGQTGATYSTHRQKHRNFRDDRRTVTVTDTPTSGVDGHRDFRHWVELCSGHA